MAELFDLTITEAARLVPGRPSPSAIWRWCRKGVRARNGQRIHLEHQRFGGRLFTSEVALQRFADKLAVADSEHFEQSNTKPPMGTRYRKRTDTQRQRDIAEAERYLDEGGI